MAQHIVIRRPEWVAGSRDRPEVGVFTQAHTARPPVPWSRIGVGEKVWMKWSGGPVVARATVEGFCQFEQCTPERLRNSVRGFRLYDLDAYWKALKPHFYGMTIYLRDEEWLPKLLEANLDPHRESWVVIENDAKARTVLSELKLRPEPRAGDSRPSRSIPVTVRFEVLRRDSFTCTYCGRRPPEVVLHVDHVVPWSQGGSNHPDNLKAACQDCNLGKRDRRLDGSGVGIIHKPPVA